MSLDGNSYEQVAGDLVNNLSPLAATLTRLSLVPGGYVFSTTALRRLSALTGLQDLDIKWRCVQDKGASPAQLLPGLARGRLSIDEA